ncbi:MAG: EAL domain-containing protein [Firmicutes bacterium]|nr:EAL domain-containing protein [Bacillota bacterium]
MRVLFLYIFISLMIAQIICAFIAFMSHKEIGRYVALLNLSLIPPVLGNFIITCATSYKLAMVGRYMFFIGIDFVMLALLSFTVEYCKDLKTGHKVPKFLYWLFAVDVIQLALNPFLGHAFSSELIYVDGMPYYRVVPYLWLTLHRLLDYGVLAALILIYTIVSFRVPKVYKEKYIVILVTMLAAGLWQAFYVCMRIPVDRSMIGFACFGLLVFYFAMFYHPFRLIDRMLTSIAADISEAMFVFDKAGKCVWLNKLGRTLTGIDGSDLEEVSKKLADIFGDVINEAENETLLRNVGSGDDTRYYSIEKKLMTDDHDRFMGSSCRIYDYTDEHESVEKRMYAATHDALTDLYTKEHLFSRIKERLETDEETDYVIAFVDVKNFKIVNDIFGKEFGDHALKCVADLIRANAVKKSIYGRIAGDTFGICMPVEHFNAAAMENRLSHFVVKQGKLEYSLLIHVGVYEVIDTSVDVSVMFDRAHVTLSRIKDGYKAHVEVYDNEIRNKILWNQQISAQLHNALKERHICPYLQPIVDRSGKTVGAEALARWIHPEHGFLSPAAFIPVFEDNGMIVDVDRHMWRCACEILKSWRGTHPDLFISVNISPKDFYFTDVVAEIKDLVSEYAIPPSALRLEITETVMMTDIEDKM